MKFGKQIQANQIPGWSAYYLDYKALKKIISALTSKRSETDAATPTTSVRPADILKRSNSAPFTHVVPVDQPTGTPRDYSFSPSVSMLGGDHERGPDFQAHKAAFFFKLERELEKINDFYLQKEAELKLRLETLLSKRRAAAMRVLPDTNDDTIQNHVEWIAVEEGFRLLERDLGKLQQFIEMNATGFRKILKKWDKRSKSSTKELYLACQVDCQPVFNRQLISEMSDTVAACLLDITDLSLGLKAERPAVNDLIFTHQMSIEGSTRMGPFRELESNIRRAVASSDEGSIRDVVRYSETLSQQPEGKTNVTRILWKAIIDAPPDLADLIISCTGTTFDFKYIDDINGRTCLHEATIAGFLRLVNICLEQGVDKDKRDIYGRSALHYACMNGHADICRRLLEVSVAPDVPDLDNYSPLVYATLNGSVDCVRALLDRGVDVQATPLDGDLIPLSLASQAGHVDVVLLLLERGAKSVPNTNGEYPIHLASKAGHASICRCLVHLDGWDVPDKYYEWTPLYHAARYGHDGCVKVLLGAGARVDQLDEADNMPVHYAAWYGHHTCVDLLLEAAAKLPAVAERSRSPRKSPPSAQSWKPMEIDVDAIPSLSLPPPIMPYRVYGHNYLDRNCLVQVSIGHFFTRFSETSVGSAVQLNPRLTGAQAKDRYLLASPFLKLVVTCGPDSTSAPHSVSLPLSSDETDVLTFQIQSLDTMQLEFSLCPNFGTKTIGRAVALPFMFRQLTNNQPFVLPILDRRLQVIGQISFEMNVIKPFDGVRLEIGGAVATYWKSITLSNSGLTSRPSAPGQYSRTTGSAHTSPSNRSAINTGGHTLTISSVMGSYIHIVVQVTRDFCPVIYYDQRLPTEDYELGVADITLVQFENLARRCNRTFTPPDHRSSTASDWYTALTHSMIPLEKLLKILPPSFGISLEVALQPTGKSVPSGRRAETNQAVDSVLRTIYDTSPSANAQLTRRRIVLISSVPDVCSALNWKQPNYPVFFVSQCGKERLSPPSALTLSVSSTSDRRLWSLGTAVEFARANNLLGVCVEPELMVRVPSLIQGVKDAGLLVGTYDNADAAKPAAMLNVESSSCDFLLQKGILTFADQIATRDFV